MFSTKEEENMFSTSVRRSSMTRSTGGSPNRNRSVVLLPLSSSSLWMMLLLFLVLLWTTTMNIVVVVLAWTPSRSSSFLIGSMNSGRHCNHNGIMRTYRTVSFASSSKWTMYQEDRTPSSSSSSSSDPINAWTVLSTTERWISRTLAQASSSSSSSTMSSSSNSGNPNNNPYVRKEISYYCEHPTTTTATSASSTSKDKNPNETTTTSSSSLFLLMASIFRHLKEMRQIGEQHVQYEIERWTMDTTTTLKNHDDMVRTTLRQTHVIVIPSHTLLTQSFVYFDTLIQTINQMRRNARDYYNVRPNSRTNSDTVSSSSSIPYEDYYSISINCAHLHPLFGQTTTTTTTTNKDTTDDDDEDPKYVEYQKQRQLARQSPYPTIVMEVRVTPTPLDLLIPPPSTTLDPTMTTPPPPRATQSDVAVVSLSDIQKLEALFGQSAYIKEDDDIEAGIDMKNDSATTMEEDENYLWDHMMGNTIHEIVIPKPPPTPIQIAQEYIASITTSTAAMAATIPPPPHISFTTTNTTHVDEAYEYVMTNIAMCLEDEHHHLDPNHDASSSYYYLVMPHFLPLAATSFEKFTREIQQCYTLIVSGASTTTTTTTTPTMTFTTYHPEHIQSTHRSPLPILAIEYHHRTSSNSVE